MRKAVHIQGLHLGTKGWEKVVWSKGSHDVLGTIQRGVKEAWISEAEVISWGTGASEIGGQVEAEFSYNFAISHVTELADLCKCSAPDLKYFLEKRSVLDMDSQDTVEEIKNFIDLCLSREIDIVTIVSHGNSAPRVVRNAIATLLSDEKYATLMPGLYLAPAGTIYEDSSMEDVVIFEKPHRPDRPTNDNHLLARRMLDILKESADTETILKEWEQLIRKYE